MKYDRKIKSEKMGIMDEKRRIFHRESGAKAKIRNLNLARSDSEALSETIRRAIEHWIPILALMS